MEKKCKCCGKILPLNSDYFFKKVNTSDGYTIKCKICMGHEYTNKLNIKQPQKGNKICKVCGRELGKENFVDVRHGKETCKYCYHTKYLKEKDFNELQQFLNREQLEFIINFCCHRKGKVHYINDLVNLLDFDLNTIIKILSIIKIKQCYARVKTYCEGCKKEIEVCLSDYIESELNFCDKKCQNEWFKNVYTKTDEFIKRNTELALNNLRNGVYSTDSSIQKSINVLLEQLNLKYENEYIKGVYAFDNYLPEYDLYIEVMGRYWHCDNRYYDNVNYKIQYERILKDKTKHSYIKNKYNIEILYLWEYDIKNNLDLCKALILEYINNNGKLENYHSFNYSFDEENKLIINKNLIKPYMEHTSIELDEIVDFSAKHNVDKFITFNCDCCGKEVKRLISKYDGFKKHYCSNKCKNTKK